MFSNKRIRHQNKTGLILVSLCSWQDFGRECFCFGSEAMNTSGKAMRGLVKIRRLHFSLFFPFSPPMRINGLRW